ncbi:hypothetical protein BY996DRAFT_4598681 [Phakopsora pachyrhizi]|nr:hypothetical protein BY996DRAFT_4598681 [Phakopsora pachyrhizi]
MSSRRNGPRMSVIQSKVVPPVKITHKKRSKSLGGQTLEQEVRRRNLGEPEGLDRDLTPRKKARRSLVPGKSILKSRPTVTGLVRISSDGALLSTNSPTGTVTHPQSLELTERINNPSSLESNVSHRDTNLTVESSRKELENETGDISSDMEISNGPVLHRLSMASNTTNVLRRVSFAAKAHVRTFGSPAVDPDSSTASSAHSASENPSSEPSAPEAPVDGSPGSNQSADMSIDNSLVQINPQTVKESVYPSLVLPQAVTRTDQFKQQRSSRLSTAFSSFGAYDDDDDDDENENDEDGGGDTAMFDANLDAIEIVPTPDPTPSGPNPHATHLINSKHQDSNSGEHVQTTVNLTREIISEAPQLGILNGISSVSKISHIPRPTAALRRGSIHSIPVQTNQAKKDLKSCRLSTALPDYLRFDETDETENTTPVADSLLVDKATDLIKDNLLAKSIRRTEPITDPILENNIQVKKSTRLTQFFDFVDADTTSGSTKAINEIEVSGTTYSELIPPTAPEYQTKSSLTLSKTSDPPVLSAGPSDVAAQVSEGAAFSKSSRLTERFGTFSDGTEESDSAEYSNTVPSSMPGRNSPSKLTSPSRTRVNYLHESGIMSQTLPSTRINFDRASEPPMSTGENMSIGTRLGEGDLTRELIDAERTRNSDSFKSNQSFGGRNSVIESGEDLSQRHILSIRDGELRRSSSALFHSQLNSASPSRRLSASPSKRSIIFPAPRRSIDPPLSHLSTELVLDTEAFSTSNDLENNSSSQSQRMSTNLNKNHQSNQSSQPNLKAGPIEQSNNSTSEVLNSTSLDSNFPASSTSTPSITLSNFFEKAEIRFITLSQPRVRNHDQQEQLVAASDQTKTSSFAQQVYAGMVKIPRLRMLESSARALRQRTEALDYSNKERESELEKNPTKSRVLRDWLEIQRRRGEFTGKEGNVENQRDIDELNRLMNRLQLKKHWVELSSKRDCYQFELEMKQSYKASLLARREKLKKDIETMRKMCETVQPSIDDLRGGKKNLFEEICKRKQKNLEIESCDQEKLRQLKEVVKDLVLYTESNRSAIAESAFERDIWIGKLKELEEEKIEHLEKIEKIKQSSDPSQRCTVQELVRLRNEFRTLQSLMGWKLVRFEDDHIEYFLLGFIEVTFHLDSYNPADQFHRVLRRVEMNWKRSKDFHETDESAEQDYLIQEFFFHYLKQEFEGKDFNGRIKDCVQQIVSMSNHARRLKWEITNLRSRYSISVNFTNRSSSGSTKPSRKMKVVAAVHSKKYPVSLDVQFEFTGEEILDWKTENPICNISSKVTCTFGRANCHNLGYVVQERVDQGNQGALKDSCEEVLTTLDSTVSV